MFDVSDVIQNYHILLLYICSQEEIESLREKMSAQTSLVVVGSADDALRINKFNRHLEGVTQSVVDNMVADEIQDFISTCILNPPGPREAQKYIHKRGAGGPTSSKSTTAKKRKHKDSLSDPDGSTPRKGLYQIPIPQYEVATNNFVDY